MASLNVEDKKVENNLKDEKVKDNLDDDKVKNNLLNKLKEIEEEEKARLRYQTLSTELKQCEEALKVNESPKLNALDLLSDDHYRHTIQKLEREINKLQNSKMIAMHQILSEHALKSGQSLKESILSASANEIKDITETFNRLSLNPKRIIEYDRWIKSKENEIAYNLKSIQSVFNQNQSLREAHDVKNRQKCDELKTKIAFINRELKYIESKLLPSNCSLTSMKDKIRNELLKLEYKAEYIKYAHKHNISYPEDDYSDPENNLFANCNAAHQESLKDGYLVEEPCFDEDDWHQTPGVRCPGWIIGEYRCECGNYKGFDWEDSNLDYNNLYLFNIDFTAPYGYVVRLG
jgi:hypothetical protein